MQSFLQVLYILNELSAFLCLAPAQDRWRWIAPPSLIPQNKKDQIVSSAENSSFVRNPLQISAVGKSKTPEGFKSGNSSVVGGFSQLARPLKTIDEKRVIDLASKGYAIKDIAALENVSYATIHRRYATACERGANLCNGMLRSKQYERAMAGSDTMLIWLGKQRLGQADKSELIGKVEHEHITIDPEKLSDSQLSEAETIIESAYSGSDQGREMQERHSLLGTTLDEDGKPAL